MDDRPPAFLTGPPLVALSLSCLLFGALSVQVYRYHKDYRHDPISLQTFVAVIYLADAVQIVLLNVFCWDVFVTGLAVQGNTPTPTPSSGAHTLVGCVIAGMVQGFFAWRIFSFRRDSVFVKIVAIVIILLALMQVVSGVVGVGLYLGAGKDVSSATLLRDLAIYPRIWLIGAVVCDLIIAIAMTWILILIRRASTAKTTQTFIEDLILRSVETGIVTFIFTLINLILFLYTDNYMYMVFDRTLSKLYSNALLLNLNARGKSGKASPTINWEVSGTSIWNGLGLTSMGGRRLTANSLSTPSEIHITTHTETRIENRAEFLSKMKS